MFFRNYPILRLLLPLVLGICMAYWTSLSIAVPWVLLLMLGCWGFSFFLARLKKRTATLLSGLFLQLVFVIAGFELCCLHFPIPDEAGMQEYCQPPSSSIIKEKAIQVQHYFSEALAEAGISGSEYSIINAILLGNKESLDTELRAYYNAVGVGHILCVSGLHVGVIFLILNFLLHPLDYSKKSRLFKALILLFFIWIYACITGLSPSVTRAATMFSFVTFGNLLHRHTNIFHSLFTSLFILLIINPLWLFNLGFQLSYAAVFGIVIFQQKLVALWTPKNKVLTYLWNLITVSVAAQLATFPLSVYTFGMFPNYFLLGNLSVVTLSFVIVVSGVLLLVVSFVPYLSTWVAQLLTFEIKLMNILTQSIRKMPGSVTENISISWVQMLLIYLCIIFFFLLLQQQKKRYYWLGLTSILALVLLSNVEVIRDFLALYVSM